MDLQGYTNSFPQFVTGILLKLQNILAVFQALDCDIR